MEEMRDGWDLRKCCYKVRSSVKMIAGIEGTGMFYFDNLRDCCFDDYYGFCGWD